MPVSRFLKCYRASGSLHDAPRGGRKCKLSDEQLVFIDEKMKENDELTSEELMKMLASQFGVEVSSSAICRVRREKLGWKYENARYCQFVREPNKIKRLAFCLNALSRKDSFDDVIFTDETSSTLACRFGKIVNQYNLFQHGKIFSYKNGNTIHILHNTYFKINKK